MGKLESVWADEMENVLDALKSTFMIEGNCKVCHNQKAVIKCHSCRNHLLCQDCDIAVHDVETLHNRVSFVLNYMQPLPPTDVLNEDLQIFTTGKSFFYFIHCDTIWGQNF